MFKFTWCTRDCPCEVVPLNKVALICGRGSQSPCVSHRVIVVAGRIGVGDIMRTTDLDEELAQPAQGTPPIHCECRLHDSHRHHGGQVMRCPSSGISYSCQVHPVSCPFSMASQRLNASQPQLGTRVVVSDPRPFSLVRHTHWHPPLCCLATPCRTCACVRSGASDPRPLSTTSLCGGGASSTCSPTMLSRSVPSSQRTSSPVSPPAQCWQCSQ